MSPLRPASLSAFDAFTPLGSQAVDTSLRDSAPAIPNAWAAPTHSPIPTTTPTIQIGREDGKGKEGIGQTANRISRLKKLAKDDPELDQLYEIHVARQLAGNHSLPFLANYLFGAVSGVAAEQLVALALDLNPDLYNGPMIDQLAALREQWNVNLAAYPSTLSPAENEAYQQLDEDEQATFRIMRSLALHHNGPFFLSCDEIKRRLRSGVNGHRMRTNFAGKYRIVELVKPGVLRGKGVRGEAAFFKWNFPLPSTAAT